MPVPVPPRRRRTRQYPIRLDPSGKSARRRAFDLFDQGMRPSCAAPLVGISPKTAYRYFQDWEKGPPRMYVLYRMLQAARRGKVPSAQSFAAGLASALELPLPQVLAALDRPWGLRQLLAQRWLVVRAKGFTARMLDRLGAALELVRLYETQGIAPERIVEALDRLARERHAAAPNGGDFGS